MACSQSMARCLRSVRSDRQADRVQMAKRATCRKIRTSASSGVSPSTQALIDNSSAAFSERLATASGNGKGSCVAPATQLVLQRLLAVVRGPEGKLWALAAVLGATVLLGAAPLSLAADGAPHQAQSVLGDLAENEEFWSNVGRYISYFFSVLLGTAYVAIKPVLELLKRPTTAVLVVLGAGALYLFVSTTVSAMLGVNDLQEYVPSSIVTPQL